MRTQMHAGQLEKVREEVPNIPPLHEKNPASSRREQKKREKDLKKLTDGENTHTHTHNARASQKCVLKNALQINTTVNVPVLLIL